MNHSASTLFPGQPDPALLEKLLRAQRFALCGVGLIAACVLAAWLIPPFRSVLPQSWSAMHAHTALTALFSALGLFFCEPGKSKSHYRLGLAFAAGAGILALAILCEYWLNLFLFVDDLGGLAKGAQASEAVRMSPQSAIAFALAALAILLLRTRRKWASRIADLAVSLLCFVVLAAVSSYISGAMQLFGIGLTVRSAPQTLSCLVLLTFVLFWRRAETGFFAILLGAGIGSRVARTVTPFVLVIPFLWEFARAHALRIHLVLPELATAIAAALAAMTCFALVLFLAWRINGLEREVIEHSLRDELTGLYNRKGFMLLASKALQGARRAADPFSVIFIDLDGLKQINDSFGHEAGSEYLAETGKLLGANVRGADIVARLGGDEFVVAGQMNEAAAELALRRIEVAAAKLNANPDRAFQLEYSAGWATTNAHHDETLDQLLVRADMVMYGEKRQKKSAPR